MERLPQRLPAGPGGRQADEASAPRHARRLSSRWPTDGDHPESLLLNTIDGWIIWTPQRATCAGEDGVLDDGERCDDGNLEHDDDCPIDCAAPMATDRGLR